MNEKLKEFNVESLFKAILKLENIDECYKFFEDLCTVQELKALAQRLQVAKMLSDSPGRSYMRTFSATPSTYNVPIVSSTMSCR